MKRQRDVEATTLKTTRFEGATIMATASRMLATKKKAKREVEKRKEEVREVEEERREEGESGFAVAENVLGWEEYCPWLEGAVDEQMSWGSLWLPVWDVEFMCESYSAFFGDVAWDDDIWNLRSIMEVPKP